MNRRWVRCSLAVLGVAFIASIVAPNSAEAGRWRKKKSSSSSSSTSLNSNYYYTAPIWARPGSMTPKKK
jgi:hypothetical protein